MKTLPPELLPPDTTWQAGKLEQRPREMPEQRALKPFRVGVVNRRTNDEAGWHDVKAIDWEDAEAQAISKAALQYRADPAELEARHVHELCHACGQSLPKGAEF